MTIDGVVFGNEGRLFYHTNENDPTDPELYFEQFAPVESAPDEPEQSKQRIDSTHGTVEDQGWIFIGTDVTTVTIFHFDDDIDVHWRITRTRR